MEPDVFTTAMFNVVNMLIFLHRGVVSPLRRSQAAGPPSGSCP
jgi:hypothetical protein